MYAKCGANTASAKFRSISIDNGGSTLEGEHITDLDDNDSSIKAFKQRQHAAFEDERERWRDAGVSEAPNAGAEDSASHAAEAEAFDGEVVSSQVSGGVWSVHVVVGDRVQAGQLLLVVESMKMEVSVLAPCDGLVEQLLCSEGQSVSAGQPLVLMRARS